MNTTLNNESQFSLPDSFLEECIQLADYVLLQEQAPLNAVVSVTLVDNEIIANMNQEYRGKQGPTDVLSFPCDDSAEATNAAVTVAAEIGDDDPTAIYWAEFDAVDDEKPLLLGDVVIAPQIAAEQSSDIEDELRLLLVHGILHLLGYDHENDEGQAEEMEQHEQELLRDWTELTAAESHQNTCSGNCCGGL